MYEEEHFLDLLHVCEYYFSFDGDPKESTKVRTTIERAFERVLKDTRIILSFTKAIGDDLYLKEMDEAV